MSGEADTDSDGTNTTAELFAYVSRPVQEHCASRKLPAQQPTLSPSFAADNPIIINRHAVPYAPLFDSDTKVISRGEFAFLRYAYMNARYVAIWPSPGVVLSLDPSPDGREKAVSAENRISVVMPESSTKYVLRVAGRGAVYETSVDITVQGTPSPTTPVLPPVPDPPKARVVLTERFSVEVKDIYFERASSRLGLEAATVLAHNAQALLSLLQDFPSVTIMIEGHVSDDECSGEKCLALADRRASTVRETLARVAVPRDRLVALGRGPEISQCTAPDEQCRKRNRRAHFSAGQ